MNKFIDEDLIIRAHRALTLINFLLSVYLIWRIQFKATLIHINLRVVLVYFFDVFNKKLKYSL